MHISYYAVYKIYDANNFITFGNLTIFGFDDLLSFHYSNSKHCNLMSWEHGTKQNYTQSYYVEVNLQKCRFIYIRSRTKPIDYIWHI